MSTRKKNKHRDILPFMGKFI